MSKILTIGTTEYLTAVRSKAFVIGVIMMPIFMMGGLLVEKIAELAKRIRKNRMDEIDEEISKGDSQTIGELRRLQAEEDVAWIEAETKRYEADVSSENKILWMFRPVCCLIIVCAICGLMFYITSGILEGRIELDTALSIFQPFAEFASIALGLFFGTRGVEKIIGKVTELIAKKTS